MVKVQHIGQIMYAVVRRAARAHHMPPTGTQQVGQCAGAQINDDIPPPSRHGAPQVQPVHAVPSLLDPDQAFQPRHALEQGGGHAPGCDRDTQARMAGDQAIEQTAGQNGVTDAGGRDEKKSHVIPAVGVRPHS